MPVLLVCKENARAPQWIRREKFRQNRLYSCLRAKEGAAAEKANSPFREWNGLKEHGLLRPV